MARVRSNTLSCRVPVGKGSRLTALTRNLGRVHLSLVRGRLGRTRVGSTRSRLMLDVTRSLEAPLANLVAFLRVTEGRGSLGRYASCVDGTCIGAARVHSLSGRLFSFFLVGSRGPVGLRRPRGMRCTLKRCLSRLYKLLRVSKCRISVRGLC